MKYLVFMWESFEASGGMNDYIGCTDLDGVIELVISRLDDLGSGNVNKVVQVCLQEGDKKVQIHLEYKMFMTKEEYEKVEYDATVKEIMVKNPEYDREDAELCIENKKRRGTLVYACVEEKELVGEAKVVEINKLKVKIRKQLEEALVVFR